MAAVREQFRTAASSSAKNSLTPVTGSRPGPGSHPSDAAPGSPSCRSALSGRRAANPVTSSALYAASADSTGVTRSSSVAISAALRAATGSSSPRRVARVTTPGGDVGSGHDPRTSGATDTATP